MTDTSAGTIEQPPQIDSTVAAAISPAIDEDDVLAQMDPPIVAENAATAGEPAPRDGAGQFTSEEKIAQRERETYEQLIGKAPKPAEADSDSAPAPESAATEQDAAAAAVQDAKPAPAAAEAAALTEQQREQKVIAERALRRDGVWSEEEIAALPFEMLVEKGNKAAKRQSDIDRKLNERQLSRKAGADNSTSSDGEGTDPTAPTAPDETGARTRRAVVDEGAPSSPQGERDDLDEVLELVRLEDSDTAARLTKAIAARENRLQQQTQVLAQQQQAATRATVQNHFETARQALAKEFPQFADAQLVTAIKAAHEGNPPPPGSALDRIVQTIDRLDPNGHALLGSQDDATTLIRDAAFIVFGPELKQQTQRDMLARNKAQRIGQPDAATVRSAPKPLSEDDHQELAFKALTQAHGNKAEAEKLLDRMIASRTAA